MPTSASLAMSPAPKWGPRQEIPPPKTTQSRFDEPMDEHVRVRPGPSVVGVLFMLMALGSAGLAAESTAPPSRVEPVAAAPPLSPAAASSSSAVPETGPAAQQDRPDTQRLRFNFRHAPWEQVLQWLADQSQLSFSADVIPRGTFTYVDQHREFSSDGAIDLVNGYLLIKGYALVRHDHMLLVIDLEEDVDRRLVSELVTEIAPDQLDQRGRYEISKTRFSLQYADAKVAEQQISPLLSPVGSLVVMPEAKQLIATETGNKLRAIREILATLEREASTKTTQLHTFHLKLANAEEVLTVARPLLQLAEGANASEDGSIRISADPLGRTVYVTGTPEKVALVRQIVTQVDGDADQGMAGRNVDPQQFMMHKTVSADPSSILRVLQTLFVGDPSLRLEVDRSSGSILAYARLSQHQAIQATIAEMEHTPQHVEVIPLRRTEPSVAVSLVEKLFKSSETPPVVDGTLDPRQLIVRGTNAQILQVRSLLTSMGEAVAERSQGSDRSNLREIHLDPETASDLLMRLRQIWPQVSRQPLRIVPHPPALPRRGATPDGQDGAFKIQPPWGPRSVVVEHRTGRTEERTQTDIVPAALTESLAHYRNVHFHRDAEAANQTAAQETDIDPVPPAASGPLPEGEENGVVITVTPYGLLLASQDPQALDLLESVLNSLRQQDSSDRPLHVFYLRHVAAESALELLSGILGARGTDTLASQATVGSATATPARTGVTGTSVVTAGRVGVLPMVADKRLNALFVQGAPDQIKIIQQLLETIDTESGPDEVLTFPKPHFIPVYYTRAADVAAILKQLYVHRLEQGQQNTRTSQRTPFGFPFLGMFGGGRESSNSNPGTTTSAGQLPKMTIAVDEGSNSVVVAAVGPLLKEVESVVREIDVRAESKPPESVTVVTLKRTHPLAVQQALSGLLGDQVQVSGSSAASRTSASSGFSPSTDRSNGLPGRDLFRRNSPPGYGYEGFPPGNASDLGFDRGGASRRRSESERGGDSGPRSPRSDGGSD